MEQLRPPLLRTHSSCVTPAIVNSSTRVRANSFAVVPLEEGDLHEPLSPPDAPEEQPERHALNVLTNLLQFTHKRSRSGSPPDSGSKLSTSTVLDILTPPPSPPRVLSNIDLTSFDLPLPAASPTQPPPILARPRALKPLLAVLSIFTFSSALLLLSVVTLPLPHLLLPKSMSDLRTLSLALSDTSRPHTLFALALAVVHFNAFHVPGSGILNVLAGLLLPTQPFLCTLYLTTLTTVGSLLSTAIATPVLPFLPNSMLTVLARLPPPTAHSLVLLRLTGIVPWSLLNLYPALRPLPLIQLAWSCALGVAPWCAVTALIGQLGGEATAAPVAEVLRRPEVIGRLVLLSALGGAPVLLKGRMKRWMAAFGGRGAEEGLVSEETSVRWSFSWDWLKRLRGHGEEYVALEQRDRAPE